MIKDLFVMKPIELINFISKNSLEYVDEKILRVLQEQQLLELAIDIENFNNGRNKELTYQQECLILECD